MEEGKTKETENNRELRSEIGKGIKEKNKT